MLKFGSLFDQFYVDPKLKIVGRIDEACVTLLQNPDERGVFHEQRDSDSADVGNDRR